VHGADPMNRGVRAQSGEASPDPHLYLSKEVPLARGRREPRATGLVAGEVQRRRTTIASVQE